MRHKPLTLISRLHGLKTRHTALEDRIRDELARPLPDSARVQTLKRMRLRTKDRITQVLRQLTQRQPEFGPEAA